MDLVCLSLFLPHLTQREFYGPAMLPAKAAVVCTFPGQQPLMGTEANKSESEAEPTHFPDLCPHPGAGCGTTVILWDTGQGHLGTLKSPRWVMGVRSLETGQEHVTSADEDTPT